MKHNTSWQPVSKWYKDLTQGKGHYYHEHVVIPGVLKLLGLKANDRLLDLACGSGVLARALPKDISYVGIDIASSLVAEAKRLDKNPKHEYNVGDVTQALSVRGPFTHATCLLALQNIEHVRAVFANMATHLQQNGTCVFVLNHPCFRIPRQSSWGIDEQNKLQYRKINRYLSPLKIPVTAHPGQGASSPVTWSFHYPLSYYSQQLHETGFVMELIEEWSSDKESEGKAAKMENRSRAEIPLFLAIKARKLS